MREHRERKEFKKNQNRNQNRIMGRIFCIYLAAFPWLLWRKELLFTDVEKRVVGEAFSGVLDTALYGKAVLTVCMGILFLCFLLYKRFWKKEKLVVESVPGSKVYLGCLWVIAAGSILSVIFSEYRELAFQGHVNSCEGLMVWLAYLVIFVAAMELFSQKENRIRLKRTLLFLCYVTTFLSLVEFLYRPLLELIWSDIKNTEYKNMVTLTMYNPGYYALFCLLLLAVSGIFWMGADTWREEVLTGSAAIGMILDIILSKSTGAFYLMFAEVAAMLLFFFIKQRGNTASGKKRALGHKGCMMLVAVCIFVLVNLLSDGSLLQTAAESSVNETRALHKERYFKLTDIEIEEQELLLAGEKQAIVVKMNENGTIGFYNKEGEGLPFEEKEKRLEFQGVYEAVQVWIEDGSLVFDLGYRDTIRFYMYDGTFYPELSDGSLVNDISGNGLWKKEFSHFATGRGWFWLGSGDVLRHCMVLGRGMGTFQAYFKQYDFVGLLNTQGTVELIVDKPHSQYIQIAVQSGVPAVAAFMVLLVYLGAHAAKHIWAKRKEADEEQEWRMQAGVLLAIVVFAIYALITDSCVTVAPLVWTLMGMQATSDWSA